MPRSRDAPDANPADTPSESDDALLARWREGDRAAGNDLFRRYFEPICRFFRNKAADDAVEDLIQNTFAGCVRGREQFRGEASFRTYVFRVACHELYGHYRRRKRVPLAPLRSSLQEFGPSPTAALAKSREQELLLRGLRHLQLDFQVALELYYWEGLSGPDLAAVLEVPEGTARSRIRRGLAALRDEIVRIAQDEETASSTLQDLEGWAAKVRKHLTATASAGRTVSVDPST